MALAMLIVIALSVGISDLTLFMTPDQFFIFGLVMAIYMPCLATVAVMWREIGWKETIVVSALSVGTAIAIGSIANLFLTIF
jgi:ferrous iron transport protein B